VPGSVTALTLLLAAGLLAIGAARGTGATRTLPPGAWPVSRSQPILDKSKTLRLAPDLRALDSDERAATADLIAAGRIVQHLYEDMNHHQAAAARRDLDLWTRERSGTEIRNLAALYRLFDGPIANTLDNRREPFHAGGLAGAGEGVLPVGRDQA
jgi:hypothetical protein